MCSLKVYYHDRFSGARDGGQTPPHGTAGARDRDLRLSAAATQLAMSFRQSRVPLPELSSYQHTAKTAKEGSTLPNHAMLEGCVVGGSMYPGESRLSATYPAAADRPGTEPAQSPVWAAHRLAELERSPTVKPSARHDSLLDLRRSRPNDVPSRWEGGSGAQPPCRPWIEAAGLRAVEELAGVFKQVTPWRRASPLLGCTKPAYPCGIAIAIPVPTRARPPRGSKVTSSFASRSAPASPAFAYFGKGRSELSR